MTTISIDKTSKYLLLLLLVLVLVFIINDFISLLYIPVNNNNNNDYMIGSIYNNVYKPFNVNVNSQQNNVSSDFNSSYINYNDIDNNQINYTLKPLNSFSEKTKVLINAPIGLYRDSNHVTELSKYDITTLFNNLPNYLSSYQSFNSLFSKTTIQNITQFNERTNISIHAPIIIVFYAPWCGHCVNFVKPFNEIARNIRGIERQPIDFAAINCVELNTICANEKINSYPTIKAYLFPADQQSYQRLGKIISPSKSSAINQYIQSNKHNINKLTSFVSKQSWKHFPSPYGYSDTSRDGGIQNRISDRFISTFNTTDRILDACETLNYMLVNELITGLDESKLSITREILYDLLQFNSLPDKEISFISELFSWLDSDTITSSTVNSYVKSVREMYHKHIRLTDDFQWTSCRHTDVDVASQSTNGYTCGLWALFHHLSVSSSISRSIGAVDLMNAIKSIVSNLFSCQQCRKHFEKAYELCHHGRCDIKSSTDYEALQLWLWRLHNAVNLRVDREKRSVYLSLRQSSVSIHLLWPSVSLCKDCWLTTSVTGYKLSDDMIDSNFNITNILNFIRLYYYIDL